MLYPKCWRNREDCEPIQCIDGTNEELTQEQYETFNYMPDSFVCSGCVKPKDRIIDQDLYRVCFKNRESDEMSDNDMQDLSSLMVVISSAMSLDSVRKIANGTVEIPAEQNNL